MPAVNPFCRMFCSEFALTPENTIYDEIKKNLFKITKFSKKNFTDDSLSELRSALQLESAQSFHRLDSVHHGHLDVHKHQVVLVFLQ